MFFAKISILCYNNFRNNIKMFEMRYNRREVSLQLPSIAGYSPC
jgi:hypothetical protein